MSLNVAFIGLTLSAVASTSLAQQPSKQGAKPGAPQKERLYCLEFDGLVGSRIREQQCKTKAAWAREGVDVGDASGK